MDVAEFYQAIQEVALFPGDVAGLNLTEEIAGSARRYELMPLSGSKRFLTGIIIPTPEEVRETMKAHLYGINGIKDLGGLAAGLGIDSDAEDIAEVEKEFMQGAELTLGILEKMISNPNYQALDLRIKAREIGAHGLVHFHPYANETFIGYPVKLL